MIEPPSATRPPAEPRPDSLRPVLGAVVGLALGWSYWPTLVEMGRRWSRDPQYSHGFLVPLFALFLLWHRREHLDGNTDRPASGGLLLILSGLALRLAGTHYHVNWVEMASLVPVLAGTAVLFAGWPILRWCGPAIAFLLFMMPLPFRVQVAVGEPLQGVATACSTFVLQTMGFFARAEGNVIVLDDIRLGVIEACNGLTMLVTFFTLATGLALVLERPLLDRIVVLLSAAPVGLAANVVRITATAVLHVTAGSEIANAVFHDWAGWLMMPLALGMLWMELWILSRLVVPAEPPPISGGLVNFLADPRQRARAPAFAPRI